VVLGTAERGRLRILIGVGTRHTGKWRLTESGRVRKCTEKPPLYADREAQLELIFAFFNSQGREERGKIFIQKTRTWHVFSPTE